jgi:hypothetical protein
MMDELLVLLSRLEPDIEGDESTSDGEGMQVFNILLDIAVYFNWYTKFLVLVNGKYEKLAWYRATGMM